MSIETKLDLEEAKDVLAEMDAEQRILWAYEHFGESLILTTSGGETSAALPDIVRKSYRTHSIDYFPRMIWVDTGYYPKETHQMIDYFRKSGYPIQATEPVATKWEIEEKYPDWWLLDKEYREIVLEKIKHAPLREKFEEFGTKAWLRGIMRWETPERADMPIIRLRNGIYQIHPIIDWSKEKIETYLSDNILPVNKHHFDITKGLDQKSECNMGD